MATIKSSIVIENIENAIDYDQQFLTGILGREFNGNNGDDLEIERINPNTLVITVYHDNEVEKFKVEVTIIE